jgi:hypothetical protein
MEQHEGEDERTGLPETADRQHRRRKRPEDWRRPRRARSEDGAMNLVGQALKARRLALGRTRAEFITDLSNVTGGRWSPSVADLLNIERRTRTVTDVELAALAKALRTTVTALMGEREK